MSARLLPILNALGCLILTGFIFLQWRGGHALENQLREADRRFQAESGLRLDAEARATRLQSDIEGLKASIEAIREASERDQKAAVDAAKAMAEQTSANAGLTDQLARSKQQLKDWEEAIRTRDDKLKELNAALVATRQRLDEAIAKLKQAGAR